MWKHWSCVFFALKHRLQALNIMCATSMLNYRHGNDDGFTKERRLMNYKFGPDFYDIYYCKSLCLQ